MAIDLTSGVPLDDTSLIQQIPLGGQVFPFTDWDAAARPKRNPIYGDDILPTSALVAGQLPDRTAPQSVHTDGKHALLVKDVSNSGTASYASNAAPYLSNAVGRTGPQPFPVLSGNTNVSYLNPLGRYVYVVTGYVYISDTNVANPIEMSIVLASSDLSWSLFLGDFIRYKSGTNDQERTYNFSFPLPNPIDMLTSFPAYDNTIGVFGSCNVDHVDGLWAVTLLTGN